jgi:hypothetical protein
MQLREMDGQVTYMEQLRAGDAPIVLINVFSVAPAEAQRLLEVWAEDAAFMKQQSGLLRPNCIAARRGAAPSSTSPSGSRQKRSGARSPRLSSSDA